MKLLYTDLQYSLTELLVTEADNYDKEGCRVFYIAPNSLSFEKERAVLETLSQEASFAITVTRFGQLARYFTLNEIKTSLPIDDTALSMIFYRALDQLTESDLKRYYHLKGDLAFILQLIDLYKELKAANIAVTDLEMEDSEKKNDFISIFLAVEDLMVNYQLEETSVLDYFSQVVASGQIDEQLSQTVLIVDGFTRFSTEEANLVAQLDTKCHQVVIGTYLSQKAYSKSFTEGNIYQASIDFFRELSQTYHVKAQYTKSQIIYPESFRNLTKLLEEHFDFSESESQLSSQDKNSFQIWQSLNQKDEIEHVAKSIRQKLYEGYRYKDILVLLGDLESYQLQICQLFDKYEIPYYFGKAEAMSHHPLVQFIDALERIYRYNWRNEDILSLLKTGLFGHFEDFDLDQFEAYVQFADINGSRKFAKTFFVNPLDSRERRKFDLDAINRLREVIYSPLEALYRQKQQTGASFMNRLLTFLNQVELPTKLEQLSYAQNENEQEKDLEVWKVFTSILEQFYHIFKDELINLEHAFKLIKTGMQTAHYRAVPATLDVVTIKSYDLVQPHSKAIVYAIGMTSAHFPKVTFKKSLINDQERALTNQKLPSFQRFEVASHETTKKNHFMALSLFNSANQKLVLSVPTQLNEVSVEISPYISLLLAFGIPLVEKGKSRFSALESDIGNYKSLLSQVIELNTSQMELSPEEENFWTVMLRYLKGRLKKEDLVFPQTKKHLQTKTLSKEVIQTRFPEEKPIHLSNSALTVFYDNQYKYFLQYVLGLQETESIHPDARQHGTYLHRVFERVMADASDLAFDNKVKRAIKQTNQEASYKYFYQEDAQGRYSLHLLEEIAKATADIFKAHQNVHVLAQEEKFQLPIQDKLIINGTIDRIDQLADQSVGIVDYKSSANVFDLSLFFNGLNSQLPTYLSALKRRYQNHNPIFGAMYLHMQEPKLDLATYQELDSKLLKDHYKELTYKGIFMESEKEHLASGAYHITNNTFTEEEVALLLAYNEWLYLRAEEKIRQGHFLINPYTKDGKSVQGDQLKAITGFEADLDFGQARSLVTVTGKNKKEILLDLMKDRQEGNQ
ncbi:ATP-dependent nuclease subunit B [Streptococcus porcinus]|uniref:ATP-dependent nuclease subunit B n=1 Tax=Streptococcus porcinus TaxID=1340 RepID=A0A7V9WQ27_STRPO|nr:ATP-dependent nuclease subunit B [Streptococcus porcinus]MBA2795037.1 ATP-dependent nuclease subunit B [Streptococcus porcinus]